MFGINGGELLVLIVVAIIVVGPERMPEYARQLREWVVALRAMVDRGRDQIKEEVGDDVDWSQFDPRQYDPRHIVREALNEPTQTARAGGAASKTAAVGVTGGVVASSTAPPAGSGAAATTTGAQPSPRAPFDSEAT